MAVLSPYGSKIVVKSERDLWAEIRLVFDPSMKRDQVSMESAQTEVSEIGRLAAEAAPPDSESPAKLRQAARPRNSERSDSLRWRARFQEPVDISPRINRDEASLCRYDSR